MTLLLFLHDLSCFVSLSLVSISPPLTLSPHSLPCSERLSVRLFLSFSLPLSLSHTHIHTQTRVQRLHEAHVPFTRPLILSRSLTRPFSPSLVYSRCFTLTLTRPPQAARSMEHAMKERKKKQEREKRVSEWKERPVSARHEARNLHDRQHEESVRVSDQGTR